ncbi:peptidoglycan editing factor PgeF [Roseibium sediminicola]|uniref:Purine nucleoside phosphorylase n=1 Tax=Roseibium sediminicola TaxID=2933272 RepID=A0ABT0GUQ9_9HYPH|nr:peptidoglycan editing factor PgeF [Roseibium sp. CAU 1639]MCK7612568.1 peptidoglycan editing factor PgeF [Roseibium sp. CAU 1639]
MKLEADDLLLEGLAHGFFTRQGGVSEGIYAGLNIGLGSDDNRENVLENRKRVADSFGVDAARLVSPYQIHSPDVITLDGPFTDGADRKADALVTAARGLVLGVATADCGPVLFADPEAGVVGAAHSGWKGAVTGVLQNTVAAMEALGARKANITAVLGPTISQKAYEVGPEFRDRFVDDDPASVRFFVLSEKPGHHMFDLPAFITSRLETLGLKTVADMGLCTYADEDRFFSYRRTTHRREPDYGRQISAIAIL